MKNLSLALNIVLLVAVAVLYYLHFSGTSTNRPVEITASASDLKLAYINSDSVLKYYDYFKVTREKLEVKGKKLEQDFRNRAQSFQNDYESYQRNLSNLTIGQAKTIEEDLTKKQQNLQMYQQTLSQELANEEAKMSSELYGKVTGFLKKFGEERGLQIVLKFDANSDVLFGGDSLDITKDVIKGLNESYKMETSVPAKKDSTASKKK